MSARVIKSLELDKDNPTVATLNRIGSFFGLEVAFVPIKRTNITPARLPLGVNETTLPHQSAAPLLAADDVLKALAEAQEILRVQAKELTIMIARAKEVLPSPE